jgi:5-methylcytosine-specific restriction endonuclease McrA
MHTLVLNADMQPVSVVPLSTIHWHDAVRIIYLDHASVLAEYDRWVVRSPTVQMRMPSVILLKKHQKHNGKVEFSKFNVHLRDKYRCQYCYDEFDFNELTYDHVVPRRDKGTTVWENIVSACGPCNQKKAHRTDMNPHKMPEHPTYWELAANRKLRPITVPHKTWADWIMWDSEVTVAENSTQYNIDEATNLADSILTE